MASLLSATPALSSSPPADAGRCSLPRAEAPLPATSGGDEVLDGRAPLFVTATTWTDSAAAAADARHRHRWGARSWRRSLRFARLARRSMITVTLGDTGIELAVVRRHGWYAWAWREAGGRWQLTSTITPAWTSDPFAELLGAMTTGGRARVALAYTSPGCDEDGAGCPWTVELYRHVDQQSEPLEPMAVDTLDAERSTDISDALPATRSRVSGAIAELNAVSSLTAGAPPPPPATGRDRYVATTGSDGAAGTQAAPWRSLSKAFDSAQPGDIVYVRGGTYVEAVNVTRSGTPGAPITIAEYPGETAVWQPAGGSGNRIPLQLSGGAGWWRFLGLTIRNATGSSTTNVYGSGSAHDVTFEDVEITGSARQGVFLDAGTARFVFRRVDVHDNGGSGPSIQDHGLYLEGAGHLVEDSTVRRHRNGFGIQIYPFARGVTVRRGLVHDALKAAIVVGGDVRDTVIEGVEFRGPFGDDVAVDSYQLSAGGNNIIRDNHADFPGAFDARQGLTAAGNTIG